MEPVTFRTDDGVRIEGELRSADGPARATAVVCHAHPMFGGSKDHPILWALRNELSGRRGVTTLLFDFRGTMGSGGSHRGGRHEVLDVRAAITKVREAAPEMQTIVCGWSFGANVALREAIDDGRVGALALIGLPLAPKDVSVPSLPADHELASFDRPVLLVAGERDEFCPADQLRAFGAGLPAGEVVILEATDHFLGRREREAAALVGGFVDRLLVDRG